MKPLATYSPSPTPADSGLRSGGIPTPRLTLWPKGGVLATYAHPLTGPGYPTSRTFGERWPKGGGGVLACKGGRYDVARVPYTPFGDPLPLLPHRLTGHPTSPTDWPTKGTGLPPHWPPTPPHRLTGHPSPAYPGLPFGASLPSPTDWGATHWPKGEAIPLPHLPHLPDPPLFYPTPPPTYPTPIFRWGRRKTPREGRHGPFFAPASPPTRPFLNYRRVKKKGGRVRDRERGGRVCKGGYKGAKGRVG